MVKIVSKKTYKFVKYILSKGSFSQIEACNATGISKGLASRVTRWLLKRGYIAKGEKGYELVMPAALLNLFPVYRRMEELRIIEYKINIDKKELADMLKRHNAVLCLTSASQFFDAYLRDPSFHAYSESKELMEELREYPSGLMSISLYKADIPLEGETEKKQGFVITDQLRTIIDLLCSNKAYGALEMIKRRWK